jgi:DNA ligase 1
MTPRLMHGYDWSGQDVSGWWASEKLNGWRAYWTGARFLTRQGELLDAPAWFVDGMPDQVLDGELWAGPGTTHDQVNGAVRSWNWRALVFRPFDVPIGGVRIEAAQAILAGLRLPPHVRPVAYSQVESTAAAIRRMEETVAAGGEGLMLRKPGSAYYTQHRTGKLLKLVPARKWEQLFPFGGLPRKTSRQDGL